MPELFPDRVVGELHRRSLLSPGEPSYSYVLECTPHGAERMVIHASSGQPVAVCSWGRGERLKRLARAAQIRRDLTSEYAILGPLLGEILLADNIGPRFVVARPWYQGTVLGDTLNSAGERMRALEAAFSALTLLHQTTSEPHRFSEQDYETYVAQPATVLDSSVIVPSRQRERVMLLADRLRTLVGEDIPSSVLHGDFELGNLLRENDGTIRVLDWELSRRQGLCFLDLVHLLIMFGVKGLGLSHQTSALQVFGAKDNSAAWSAPFRRRYEDVIGIAPCVARRLAALTTLYDTASYLTRAPFLTHPETWADRIDAADQLLFDHE